MNQEPDRQNRVFGRLCGYLESDKGSSHVTVGVVTVFSALLLLAPRYFQSSLFKDPITDRQKEVMVLGLLTAIAACPAIIGTTEAVRQGQRNNAKEKHRGQKSNLIVSCPKKSSHCSTIDGRVVILHHKKVCLF